MGCLLELHNVFSSFRSLFASLQLNSTVSIVNNIQNDVSEKRVSRPSPFSCTKIVFVSRKGAGIKNKNEEPSALRVPVTPRYNPTVGPCNWVLLGRGCENKYLIHSNESNLIRDSTIESRFFYVKQPPQIFLRLISSFVERSGRCWCAQYCS